MKKTGLLLVALLASVGHVAPVFAQTTSTATPTTTAPAVSADVAAQDFGRLSADGGTASEDIGLARQAIFDGDLDAARRLIADAAMALERAKVDNTAFQKAETDLQPTKTKSAVASHAASASSTPVAWLPIDGELVLDEAIDPTSEKTAAVASANRHLRAGNTARAANVLKVSGIDADYIIAAVPLEQTRRDVAKAAKFIKSNPYKASEALRDAENAVRYASVNIQAVPTQAPSSQQAPAVPAK
nr:YfdX family protein [uncultured Acetobacter sp.]